MTGTHKRGARKRGSVANGRLQMPRHTASTAGHWEKRAILPVQWASHGEVDFAEMRAKTLCVACQR